MGRRYQLNCSFSDGSTKSAGSFEIPDGEPALVYGAVVPQIPSPVVNIALPVSGFNRTPVIGDVVNIVCGANDRSGIAIGKITAVDSTNATCNITSFVETTGQQGPKGDAGARSPLYIHHIDYMRSNYAYVFSIFSNSRADRVRSFEELVSIMEEDVDIPCSSGDGTVVAVKRSGSDLMAYKNDISADIKFTYWTISNGTVVYDAVQTIN